jgi:hypothetical protein
VPRRVSVLQPTANSYYAPRLRPRPPRFPDDCKLITVSLAYLLLIIIQSTPKSADLLLTRPVAKSPVWRHSGRPAKESRNVVAFSNPSCITHHASRITSPQGTRAKSIVCWRRRRYVVLPVIFAVRCPDPPAPAERQTQQEGGGKLKLIT